jgi:hypothetical protein
MCIAICKPKDIIIPNEYLAESFEYNPDGAGFMYAENNELIIQKGFMDYDSFLEAWEPHKEKAAALHFRIRTHGATDETNTHPFRVGPHLGFIHNGVISKVDTDTDKSKSDTFHFNEQFLKHFYKRDSRFIYKDHFKALIKEYIGWSKLVFLNNKGHFTIVNEDAGKWDEGVWYSNNSYKPVMTHNRRGVRQNNPQLSCVPQSQAQTTEKKEANQTSSPAQTYRVGVKVKIANDKHGRWKSGTGTIKWFGGGLMVGVERDDTHLIEVMHMSYISLPSISENPFQVGDYVTRIDQAMGDKVGEVAACIGDSVVVKWLDNMGMPAGPDYLINFHKLEQHLFSQSDY